MSLNDALASYNAARRELTEYDAEFGPLLEQRALLASEVDAAKAALTEGMDTSGIDWVEDADFGVSLVRADRGEYRVDRLPATKAVFDVCTMTVSNADVAKLIKRGLLSQDEADAAYESKPTKPYVRVTMKIADGMPR